MGISISQSETN